MKLKKVLAPCLAALLLLTTVGCSSSDSKEEGYSGIGKNTFSLSETNIVENICEYNVKSIVKSSKVEPSITSTYYTFYEVKTEGNTYVDITLDVKNLKKEDEQADDLMTAKTKVGGQEYKAFSVVESSDGTKLESYGSIKPLETKLVHYLVEVPETVTKEEIEIILTIDGKDYKNKVNLESVKPKKEVIEIGKRLEKEGFAELTIENLSFTDRLEPSNPSGYYRYYEATSSDDIYLVLEASVKNLKSSDLDGKKVLGAKALSIINNISMMDFV